MASWTIPAGCVAGVYISWQGILDGKTVIDLNVRWRKGQTLEPDWKIDGDGWVIQVDGQPTVTTKVGFLPPPYFEATTIEEFMDLGHIMTAVPAINAIPGRRRRGAGHRDVCGSTADAAARVRQNLKRIQGCFGACPEGRGSTGR